MRVGMPAGSILVVNVPWLPYWSATVDGQPVPMVPANLIHMAVTVPARTLVVEFTYRRPPLTGRSVVGWASTSVDIVSDLGRAKAQDEVPQ